MLTTASPPLKEVREQAQRSMCIGGMFNFKSFSCMLTVTSLPILMVVYADRHISPFEGGRGDVLKVFRVC